MVWHEWGHGGAPCIPAEAADRHSHGQQPWQGILYPSRGQPPCIPVRNVPALCCPTVLDSHPLQVPQAAASCNGTLVTCMALPDPQGCKHSGGTSAVALLPPGAQPRRWRAAKPVSCQHSTAHICSHTRLRSPRTSTA